MKIAFLKGTSIVDRLIQLWTLSKYSHCEMIFSDHTSFGTSLELPFKTVMSYKTYDPMYWDVVEVNIPAFKEQIIKDFCMTQIGKSYDWKAIFFSMILPLRQDSSDKWICSEVCTAGFQRAGYFNDIKACRVNPGKFRKLLDTING
jgi:hypothetical protein